VCNLMTRGLTIGADEATTSVVPADGAGGQCSSTLPFLTAEYGLADLAGVAPGDGAELERVATESAGSSTSERPTYAATKRHRPVQPQPVLLRRRHEPHARLPTRLRAVIHTEGSSIISASRGRASERRTRRHRSPFLSQCTCRGPAGDVFVGLRRVSAKITVPLRTVIDTGTPVCCAPASVELSPEKWTGVMGLGVGHVERLS
jgi:hypothetical protein